MNARTPIHPIKTVARATKSAGSVPADVKRALRDAARDAAHVLAAATGRAVVERETEFRALAEAVLATAEGRAAEHAQVRTSRDSIDLLRASLVAALSSAKQRVSSTDLLSVLSAMDQIVAGIVANPPVQEPAASPDAFSGMVEIAHDMRSPLSAILLLVEPIRRGKQGPITPLQERQLGIIYGAALSLSTLSNDILDAARGGRRHAAAQRPFSVSATIQDACAVVRPIAEEKKLELLQTYPGIDGRIGDSAALHRVLLNLTSNALKYTDAGSVALGGRDVDQHHVEFWVKDTGRGIPDQVLATLFESFRQTESGLRFSSSGLGLGICRSLLAGMGSKLEVETSPEHGTRFSFVLALEPAPAP